MGPVNCDESIPKMAVWLCRFSTLRNATTVVSCQVTEICHTLATACLLIHDTLGLDCSDAAALMQTMPCCVQRLKKGKGKKRTGPSSPNNRVQSYESEFMWSKQLHSCSCESSTQTSAPRIKHQSSHPAPPPSSTLFSIFYWNEVEIL